MPLLDPSGEAITPPWRQERGGAGEDLHFLLVSLALSFEELAHSLSIVLVSFLL